MLQYSKEWIKILRQDSSIRIESLYEGWVTWNFMVWSGVLVQRSCFLVHLVYYVLEDLKLCLDLTEFLHSIKTALDR